MMGIHYGFRLDLLLMFCEIPKQESLFCSTLSLENASYG